MRKLLASFSAALLALSLAPAARAADASAWFTTDQGRVRLVAAEPAVGAAPAIALGLQFELAPQWKIYWRTPGDAGYPPQLDWTGSQNLAAARVTWPAPQRFSVLGLETAGYEGEVVLPIEARLAAADAPLVLRLALDYLTCKDICIPYQTVLTLDLPAASSAGGGYAALIARYAARVPGEGDGAALRLDGATLRPGDPPTLELAVASDRPLAAPDAFVEGAAGVTFGAPKPVNAPAHDVTLLELPAFGAPAAIAAVPGRRLTVTLTDGSAASSAAVTASAGAPADALARLVPMLGLALLGGLILNFMPCVLPVLSLKLLGAIADGEHAPGAVRAGFLATAAGILISFLALAAATVLLAAAGHAAGWGVQFQSPLFLAAMVALLTLFAANLWGLWEVPLPQRAAGLAMAASRRRLAGNVAVGALATVLATPCSAPFLGTAVGFALAAGPLETMLVFLALGIGFAAPYLAVALEPRLARLLPRPGRWMAALRRVLGVALAGTAIWLLWVLAGETRLVPALCVAAAMVALIAALKLIPAGVARRAVAAALIALALLPALLPGAPGAASASGAEWRRFDPVALGDLVAQGKVVFVDVTAEWCLTCKVNERLVLDSAAIRNRLDAPGIVAMRADWTRPDPAIADYLRRFGRYGIPFNAVYGPGAPAGIALPEILTAAAVREALAAAANRRG